jgi:pyruvate dehydrogenase E1 component alpha subunit
MAPATILAWWRGHPAGWWDPRERKVASICVPIATHVPHAAGLAWGLRLRGERSCAVCYFGDGATSEGAFHEGANFAAVMDAPLVLLCNNNQWAISTPIEAQTRAVTLADKAAGYGMPGVRVDGDVLAIYAATREAVARARAGEGPTLIEAVTYRMAPHATADDQSLYIDEVRVEEERRNECLVRYEGYLRRRGILTEELAESVRGDALAAMRDGIAAAEALPAPDPALVFDTAYADPPPQLLAERAELLRLRAKLPTNALRLPCSVQITPRWRAMRRCWLWARTSARWGASSARRPACATGSGATAASTRRSRRRASSVLPWASRWRASAPCARCSTTPSPTPASTS